MAKPILLIKANHSEMNCKAYADLIREYLNNEYHVIIIYEEKRTVPFLTVLSEEERKLNEEQSKQIDKIIEKITFEIVK